MHGAMARRGAREMAVARPSTHRRFHPTSTARSSRRCSTCPGASAAPGCRRRVRASSDHGWFHRNLRRVCLDHVASRARPAARRAWLVPNGWPASRRHRRRPARTSHVSPRLVLSRTLSRHSAGDEHDEQGRAHAGQNFAVTPRPMSPGPVVIATPRSRSTRASSRMPWANTTAPVTSTTLPTPVKTYMRVFAERPAS